MKILSIEDEPVIAARIERLSQEILGDQLEQFVSCDHYESAIEKIKTGNFDAFLLDLNLSGDDGFELLRRSTSYSAQTIIISAYKEKAIEAFDYGVIDFVAKPFSRDRLKLAFDRLAGRKPSQRTPRFLSFRIGSRTDFAPIDQVTFIAGADKYAEVHFANGDTRLHDKSLAKLEKILPPSFLRIHKSYIVQRNAIKSLHAKVGSRYFAELFNGTTLPVSRARFKGLQAEFS